MSLQLLQRVPKVLNLLNQGRSMDLHTILTIQSIADLGQKVERNPDLFIEQVLANCNVYCVHGMNNANDAGVLARSIGTKKRLEITSQLSSDGVTGMRSARNLREFLAHPDDIKTLGVGEAFYLDKPNKKFARVKIKQL